VLFQAFQALDLLGASVHRELLLEGNLWCMTLQMAIPSMAPRRLEQRGWDFCLELRARLFLEDYDLHHLVDTSQRELNS